MKALQLYLEEIFTTPANTTGMGNVSIETDMIQPVCITGKPRKLHKKKKK